MKFFNFKQDEQISLKNFNKSCTFNGVRFGLTRGMISCLSEVAVRVEYEPLTITQISINSLSSRGFIQQDNEGHWRLTELGFHAMALVEASGNYTEEV